MRAILAATALLVATSAHAEAPDKPTYVQLGLGLTASSAHRLDASDDGLTTAADVSAAIGRWLTPYAGYELEAGFGRGRFGESSFHNRVSVAHGVRLALPRAVSPFVATHVGYRYDRGVWDIETAGVEEEGATTTHQLFADTALGLQVNHGTFMAQTAFHAGLNVVSWGDSQGPVDAAVDEARWGGLAHLGFSARVGVRW